VPMACDLLDGVFLAARVKQLRTHAVRFDPQFAFHCYDSDFCYTARARGLRLGTWPLPLTHASAGSFDDQWIRAARQLQVKLASAGP
jgi:protein O-GlcNAc transferase